MRCGDGNGCFLSFAPRPSSLMQTAGKDASASHVVKQVFAVLADGREGPARVEAVTLLG